MASINFGQLRKFVARPASPPVYIIDGVRTAIGRPFKGLKNVTAAQLAATVIKEILHRNKIHRDLVNEVILGNTVSAGTGQNFARQAALSAGLSPAVRAYLVNNVCGSGLQSVILGCQSLQLGQSELVVAGGAESASLAPQLVSKVDAPEHPENKSSDSLLVDGLFCAITQKHMGDLCEMLVQEQRITRQQQDQYALQSHQKALIAKRQDKFHNEIVPVMVAKNRVFYEDERPRPDIDLEKLQSLRPAFKKEGTITAGNSSSPSDGAAVVVLAGESVATKERFKPLARIVSYAWVPVAPEKAFAAAGLAVRECLSRGGLSLKQIDLFEVSESFAAQAIFTQRELNIPDEKLNIWGGDVALGHPLGAVGTRSLVTLAHALRDQNKQRGVACVCLGGGGAVAMAIENVVKPSAK